jgi:alpha-glucosidase (family GH31 glycosyl hydrolase)
VHFDLADPRFVEGYFALLHHPYEEQGVDFWWLDWQQGQRMVHSKQPVAEVMDPLWWLNHLHFYDLGRGDAKRPFIFSRWGGLGSQRYPIGFSGDSVVSWATLAFQPYFTATASNVALRLVEPRHRRPHGRRRGAGVVRTLGAARRLQPDSAPAQHQQPVP